MFLKVEIKAVMFKMILKKNKKKMNIKKKKIYLIIIKKNKKIKLRMMIKMN